MEFNLNEQFISVTQYAKKVGVSTQYIRKMIKEGRLLHSKIGEQYIIPSGEMMREKVKILYPGCNDKNCTFCYWSPKPKKRKKPKKKGVK